MSLPQNQSTAPKLPGIAAVHAGGVQSVLLTADGEVKTMPNDQVRMILHKKEALVCYAPFTCQKLGLEECVTFDVLELFAFVHPARFCLPTPQGLCHALGLDVPNDSEDIPFALFDVAGALLRDLQNDPYREKADPIKIARVMGLSGKGWVWAPYIFNALGQSYDPAERFHGKTALNIWKDLPEWAEDAPEPPPGHHGVSEKEARDRLGAILGTGAEDRPEQMRYATQVAAAFSPVDEDEEAHIVLADAGTGTGKTLGYLAPASVWAEKNQGSVWVSTFTKNLQRQIDQELDRIYPSPTLKETRTAIRKGRENYLCLLNLEELAAGSELAKHPINAIAAGIMTRWAAVTKDGDLSGADFPGWLINLLGYQHSSGLADRRGECIYSACDHYHRCFVERSVRKAKRAQIVVANHALVMIQSALGGTDLPGRYVFDEGHHIFDAADSAYAAHLTAQETRDLRRWILGGEGGRRSRARGLKRRVEDLIADDVEALRALDDIIMAASILPSDGWTRRLKDKSMQGACEHFLSAVYAQVMARSKDQVGGYSLETDTYPVIPEVIERAQGLEKDLKSIQKPMQRLIKIIKEKLEDDQGELEGDTRKRLDAVAQGLERRAIMTLGAWIGMLGDLQKGSHEDGFIDWMEIERIEGRAVDVGMYRHYTDPMKPFAASMQPFMQGMVVTSATLLDGSDDEAENWLVAQERSGASYLSAAPMRADFQSPFDYQKQTRIFVLQDVNKDDLGQVSGAYNALFQASKGGALGLFTAISRLRAVHEKLSGSLEQGGMNLYAQHIDAADTGTLVDMFREDQHACLLGTDAIRDGVDVPGDSLRLIVFDRVPWPRPTILHKARKDAFGGRRYDEMLTRLKLKQAFGRLIRRQSDQGVFVMLDSRLPSRLYGAFPKDAEVIKCGLHEAVSEIGSFFGSKI